MTAFFKESGPAGEVEALLASAGLELWQAPEGFWAIRAKPVGVATPPRGRRPQRAA